MTIRPPKSRIIRWRMRRDPEARMVRVLLNTLLFFGALILYGIIAEAVYYIR